MSWHVFILNLCAYLIFRVYLLSLSLLSFQVHVPFLRFTTSTAGMCHYFHPLQNRTRKLRATRNFLQLCVWKLPHTKIYFQVRVQVKVPSPFLFSLWLFESLQKNSTDGLDFQPGRFRQNLEILKLIFFLNFLNKLRNFRYESFWRIKQECGHVFVEFCKVKNTKSSRENGMLSSSSGRPSHFTTFLTFSYPFRFFPGLCGILGINTFSPHCTFTIPGHCRSTTDELKRFFFIYTFVISNLERLRKLSCRQKKAVVWKHVLTNTVSIYNMWLVSCEEAMLKTDQRLWSVRSIFDHANSQKCLYASIVFYSLMQCIRVSITYSILICFYFRFIQYFRYSGMLCSKFLRNDLCRYSSGYLSGICQPINELSNFYNEGTNFSFGIWVLYVICLNHLSHVIFIKRNTLNVTTPLGFQVPNFIFNFKFQTSVEVSRKSRTHGCTFSSWFSHPKTLALVAVSKLQGQSKWTVPEIS